MVGGGDIAARKISLLHRAGAKVYVVARKLCEELATLHQQQQLIWLATEFEESQLDAVFLVIAATNDNALNQRVYNAAEQRQKLVNVVDDQARCSFIFPSIVDRSPLVVAISSGEKRRYWPDSGAKSWSLCCRPVSERWPGLPANGVTG